MLFNSFTFLVFFVAFFLSYWFVFNKKLSTQNLFLLLGSYLFYGWWDWRFLILIIITTISDFYSGVYIEKKSHYKNLILIWTLILNIGVLVIFKYSDFIIQAMNQIFDLLSLNQTPNSESSNSSLINKLIIPVGISFYTFQSISYVIDVYRSKIKASHNLIEYATFIAFWPQLVAGPIERAGKLLTQVQNDRIFDYELAKSGLQVILWGAFKKVLIADNCAPIVDNIFMNYQDQSSTMLIYGVFLFGIQIYCDFSSYSEIAKGCARLLGFDLMLNFDRPYFATNIQEFWSKWHISLTTWFKDYVYIPLGGNAFGKMNTYRNIFIVFLISGIWHGANWTYIFWGLYHFILYYLYLQFFKSKNIQAPNKFWVFINLIFTQILVFFGWLIFRSETITDAMNYCIQIFEFKDLTHFALDAKSSVAIMILFFVEYFGHCENSLISLNKYTEWKRWVIYFLIVIMIITYGNFSNQSFIYFNF
jgi:alginate O-acetyltransferase complex protein AlgI